MITCVRYRRTMADPVRTPRWFTETEEGHSQWYADHFRTLAAEGRDLEGEARLLDAIIAPNSLLLDAGCGQGRVAAALHRRGHRVLGVDIDPVLLEAARRDSPGPDYVQADLTTLDLDSLGSGQHFDAIVCAGNVITYVAANTEVDTLRTFRRLLRPDGVCVIGFHVERYPLDQCDRDLADAGFVMEQRFATWDLRPWHADAEFAVTILRV
jgi:2-polyprenyl-3-methyl-5-hydroxy-6-metoxy-1,4-benzoquinol methylase